MAIFKFVLVISMTLLVVSRTTAAPLPGLGEILGLGFLGGSTATASSPAGAPTSVNTAAVPVPAPAPTVIKAAPVAPSSVDTAAVPSGSASTGVSSTGINAAAAQPAQVIKQNAADTFTFTEEVDDEEEEEEVD